MQPLFLLTVTRPIAENSRISVSSNMPTLKPPFSDPSDRFAARGPQISTLCRQYITNINNGLSDEEKWRRAKQEIKAFLISHPTREALLTALKKKGVKVFDAIEQPWVQQLCEAFSCGAFLYTPTKPLSPDEPYTGSDELEATLPEAFMSVREELENKGQFAIFLSATTDLHSLQHETVHLFQALHGLSLESPIEAVEAANQLFETILLRRQALKKALAERQSISEHEYELYLHQFRQVLPQEIAKLKAEQPQQIHHVIQTLRREQEMLSFFNDLTEAEKDYLALTPSKLKFAEIMAPFYEEVIEGFMQAEADD